MLLLFVVCCNVCSAHRTEPGWSSSLNFRILPSKRAVSNARTQTFRPRKLRALPFPSVIQLDQRAPRLTHTVHQIPFSFHMHGLLIGRPSMLTVHVTAAQALERTQKHASPSSNGKSPVAARHDNAARTPPRSTARAVGFRTPPSSPGEGLHTCITPSDQ